MQPNTLAVLNKLWDFRADTKLPLCFTLDAGANVHLLYPETHKAAILFLLLRRSWCRYVRTDNTLKIKLVLVPKSCNFELL